MLSWIHRCVGRQPIHNSTSTDTYQDRKLWKYCSESATDVPCISQVKGQGLQTVILCDRSPNLLSRDACYTLGVLNLATLWKILQIPQILLCHQ